MLVLLPDAAVVEGAAKEEEEGAAVVGENDEEVGVAEEDVLQRERCQRISLPSAELCRSGAPFAKGNRRPSRREETHAG